MAMSISFFTSRLLRALFAIAAFACAFVMCVGICALPAWALSRDEVAAWFSEQGLSAVISRAAKDLPSMSANDVAALQIGWPRAVNAIVSADSGSTSKISESNWWIASLNAPDGEYVGALWADFSASGSADEQVTDDAALAALLRDIAQGLADPQSLVFDPQLRTWFFVHDNLVSQVGEVGKRIVAGEINLDDFLVQRDRLIGIDAAKNERLENSSQAMAHEDRRVTPVGIVVTALLIVALMTVSLLWLRWEQHHAGDRAERLAEPNCEHSNTRSFAVVEDGSKESVPSLGKASGKVHVYRRVSKEEEE